MNTATTTAPALFLLREASIELNSGERYAGIVLDAEGLAAHHLVLLPQEAVDISWDAAKAWATSIGGELPTRQEQSLLFANLKSQFKRRWHWSCEEYEAGGSYAWDQLFYSGSQDYNRKSYEGCARAVRRFPA